MDAFAWGQRRSSSVPWLTVNWDNWLTAKAADQGATRKDTSFFISSTQGREVLHRVFSISTATQLVISTGDLQERIDQWVKFGSLQDEASRAADLPSSHSRPELKTHFAAPRNETEKILTDIWSNAIGVAPVGIEDNFFELGGDSILSIQIIAKAHQVGLHITTQQIFEHQTIAQLAKVIGTTEPSIPTEQGPVTGPVPLAPDALRSDIDQARSQKGKPVTPADFPGARLTQEELDKLLASLGQGT